MRLNDILDESVLNELTYGQTSSRSKNAGARPQGFLSKLGTGIASTLHPQKNVRDRASGIASASKEANKLMSTYQNWLGGAGYDGPTKENLIAWMTQQRLPLDGRVKQALDKIVAPTPATPAPSPGVPSPRIEPTAEADEGDAETPITNQQVSDVLSTAIMVKRAGTTPATPAPGAPAAPGTPASPAPGGPTPPPSPAPRPAPTITTSAVAQYYNSLNIDGRKELRQQLDMIDAAPAEEPASPAPAPAAEGFSRFLGMTL